MRMCLAESWHSCVCRVHTFLSATQALAGRCVEFSSLVSPAARAANLAAFRSGAAQVQTWKLTMYCSACLLARQQASWAQIASLNVKFEFYTTWSLT